MISESKNIQIQCPLLRAVPSSKERKIQAALFAGARFNSRRPQSDTLHKACLVSVVCDLIYRPVLGFKPTDRSAARPDGRTVVEAARRFSIVFP